MLFRKASGCHSMVGILGLSIWRVGGCIGGGLSLGLL